MDRQFEIAVERKMDNKISVRLYSEHELKLVIRSIKAFFQPESYDEFDCKMVALFLNNSASIKTFTFPKMLKSYRSLNFILEDRTNKMQFAVRIPLDDTPVEYKQMAYERNL